MRNNIDSTGLVEITSVIVDKELPQSERCSEFRRQIKDMHNYTCKAEQEVFTVRAVYASNGAKIEDCLRGMMA